MAFWNRRAEQRALTSGLQNPAGFVSEALMSTPSPSGKRVTVASALGLTAVWSAVSLISEQVGQLPLKVYRRFDDAQGDSERVEARSHRSWGMLHDKPNSHTTADRFWSTVTAQLLLHGNAFIEKRRDGNGVVDELFILDPQAVTVAYNPETAEKRFIYRPTYIGAGGNPREFDTDGVLHIFDLSLDGIVGLSVIQSCKTALGAAIARDEFEGGFYARGAVFKGYVKHPNALTPEAAQNVSASIKNLFGGSAKAHGTPVFEEGMEYVPIGNSLSDLEFVAAQNMSRTDIAVMFKLPPNLLGGSTGDSLTYATVESNQLQFALHAIAPRANTIAKALSNDPGILPQNVFEAEFTLEAMMRGDAKARTDYYTAMSALKAITVDEIRSKENLSALSDAQRKQLNPAPSAPQQLQLPVTTDASAELPANVTALQRGN